MNAVVLLVVGVAILVAGYIFYGGWLAKQWGLGENKEETPAHTMEDGQDYVPAKAPVLWDITFRSTVICCDKIGRASCRERVYLCV